MVLAFLHPFLLNAKYGRRPQITAPCDVEGWMDWPSRASLFPYVSLLPTYHRVRLLNYIEVVHERPIIFIIIIGEEKVLSPIYFVSVRWHCIQMATSLE